MDYLSHDEAEKLAGFPLDKRRKYYLWDAYMNKKKVVCYTGYWTDYCTGCCELGEYGSGSENYSKDPKHGCLVGSGCPECGYTGKRRQSWAIPATPKRQKEDDF